jgi:hypothetical protein
MNCTAWSHIRFIDFVMIQHDKLVRGMLTVHLDPAYPASDRQDLMGTADVLGAW